MFPASTKGGGMATLTGPLDVCKTPAPPAPVPPPMPYPNIAQVSSATGTSDKVKIMNQPAVTTKSEIPSSSGDEAGVAGGLVSGVNMNKVAFKTGSSSVKIEGEKTVHLGSVTGHNGSNANMPAGAQVAPSQTKLKVMP